MKLAHLSDIMAMLVRSVVSIELAKYTKEVL